MAIEAKQIGEMVQEFTENSLRENLADEALTPEAKIRFIDHLGSALIMQGCSIMIEAGAPPDVVLARSVAITKSYMKKQAEEAVGESVKESQSVVRQYVSPIKIVSS